MKKLQNNFTTPEQSKRLLELGVPDDSADLQIPYIEYYDLSPSDNEKIVQYYEYLAPIFWDETERGLLPKDKVVWEREFAGEKYDGHTTEYIPCWSGARLIEIFSKCYTGAKCYYSPRNLHKTEFWIERFDRLSKIGFIDFSKLEE